MVVTKEGIYSYGWICPHCGKVLAPDVKECICKPKPKSNIDNSFYIDAHFGFCRIEPNKYISCPQNPSYENCHFCVDWIECIPV